MFQLLQDSLMILTLICYLSKTVLIMCINIFQHDVSYTRAAQREVFISFKLLVFENIHLKEVFLKKNHLYFYDIGAIKISGIIV